MKHKLNIPYKDFEAVLNEHLQNSQTILNKSDVSGKEMEIFVKNTKLEIENFLKNVISPKSDVLSDMLSLYNEDSFIYDSGLFKKDLKDWGKRKINNIIQSVTYIKDISSTATPFVNPDEEFETELNVTDKMEFVLRKLHLVYSENFYSIGEILKLNNISFRGKDAEEIAIDLKRRGYIIRERDYSGDKAKLTVKGASYVERKSKARTTKKTTVGNLDDKLDEILLRLKKLGYGQEVIFTEIEELRDYQTKLSKKSWTQLLKGKLFDMGVEEVISKETALMIYEFLTNDKLKLM